MLIQQPKPVFETRDQDYLMEKMVWRKEVIVGMMGGESEDCAGREWVGSGGGRLEVGR